MKYKIGDRVKTKVDLGDNCSKGSSGTVIDKNPTALHGAEYKIDFGGIKLWFRENELEGDGQ